MGALGALENTVLYFVDIVRTGVLLVMRIRISRVGLVSVR